jgi:hypothetical protein
MRVLVCGGRNYTDFPTVYDVLDEIDRKRRITHVITGGAAGADQFATGWAMARLRQPQVFLAAWGDHGKKAGPIRNQRMLDEGKPDLVVAFPGGRGTADMVRRARAAGVAVREVAE